jgi:acyl transferase domain-containing protein/NAD(P)-dependent dehydrogenase (short-subunit alcohol dehydrogenase family)
LLWKKITEFKEVAVPSESKPNALAHIPVAIVGMACLFPGSPGLKAYWQLLARGRDAITDIPKTHWSTDAYFDKDPKKPDHVYCKRGAFLPSVPFDPSEYGIPPSSLEATDTSQLLALITARDALGDAGYGSGKAFNRKRTSVILGVTGTQEMVIPLGARLGHPLWRDAILKEGVSGKTAEKIVQRISDAYVPWQENSFPGLLGNVVAGRICNRLDLGGTNCVVDAACASSMSAVHLALLELQSGRSDMVITGGVDAINDIFMHMCFAKTLILSKTGDIRPFSKDADGTVLGEGIGMVVLKRLTQAEKDGDQIYAVIKGMGSSSDGRSQSIYAPRAEGQAEALRMAYAHAQVETGTIGLVEAHGTGTRVGDRVELNALKTVFGSDNGNRNLTALGSVKSMIGHTKAAAGAAGLIKATLALKNKVLPPTLKAQQTDPELNLEASPFYVNSFTRPWLPRQGHPRRAAVSSFGFGGSNFHLVLEEYDSQKKGVSWDGSVEIFAFSAQDRQTVSKKLVELKEGVDETLSDPAMVNRLAADTRSGFAVDAPCRLLFVHAMTGVPDNDREQLKRIIDDAQTALTDVAQPGMRTKTHDIFFSDKPKPGKLAFIFPGQGSQYLDMGRDLCCAFPEALNAIALTDALAGSDEPISASVFPCGSSSPEIKKSLQKRLNRTDIAQPAIGGISLAMFDILQRFGIHPDATGGHSYGELSALHTAGWIERETMMTLSAIRGRAMAEASDNGPQGAMLAVKAAFSDLEALLTDIPDVVLANVNSPEQCVLSGPLTGIERVEKMLGAKGVRSIRLAVSAAFHSPMIHEAQATFKAAVQKAELVSTDIPVFANSSGSPYTQNAENAKTTLSEQMLQPVHFVTLIANMYAAGMRTFVEVGPKNVLTGLVKSILAQKPCRTLAMDASCGKKFGVADLACVIAELASMGYPVRLDQWEDRIPDEKERRMTVMLNGANYRNEKSRPDGNHKCAPPPSMALKMEEHPLAAYPAAFSHRPTVMEKTLPKTEMLNESTTQPKQIQMKNNEKMKSPEPAGSAFVNDALQTVTQGLKSMQALQARTAEAHQKFLETQAEAGRTLQRMMESTQRLTEAMLGLSRDSMDMPEDRDAAAFSSLVEKDASIRQPTSLQTSPAPSSVPRVSGRPSEETPVSSPIGQLAKVAHAAPPVTGKAGPDNSIIASTLLEVVSELTGYPVDMLNMDMDVEADLGIDSIKRVEILSSLEEKLPGLPGVEPDTLATLKTLGQIAGYMGQVDDAEPLSRTENNHPGSSPETQKQPHGEKTVLSETLLGIVSELTGYPVDMLDMDMDIEGDLGIDSIKRVEILSTLEERIPGLPAVTPELMGSLKTLGQIADYLTGCAADAPSPLHAENQNRVLVSDLPDIPAVERAPSYANNAKSGNVATLARKSVKVQEAPPSSGRRLTIKPKRRVFFLQDHSGLAAAIVERFQAHGVDAALMTRSMAADIIRHNKPLSLVSGLVIIADANPATDLETDRFLKTAFQLVQAVARDLNDTGEGSHTLLATITRLDGAFGFSGRDVNTPAMGGLAGLLKTAAIEWPGVCCRALDIDPAWNDLQGIAARVAEELLSPTPSESLEIGLTSDHRYTLALQDLPSVQGGSPQGVLGKADVVVVTGGARGVTAASALAVARHSRAKMVLIGRSEQPLPEPLWLQDLSAPSDIKRAILENEFNNNGASPKDIERSYARHMTNREMHSTFRQFEKIDGDMRYIPLDIRDSKKLAAAIDDVRNSWGPITAVIHGAGVIEDRLIVDKTLSQLDLVFDTKVVGLRNLLAATRKDALKHLVLFSSVSARNGNTGQADYAMANEVLNKMAIDFSHKNPDCHVLSINWGPWDGGMVTPTLKKVFEKQNIGLIPLEQGTRSLLFEMGSQQENHPVEMVIGSIQPTSAVSADPAKNIDNYPDKN